MMSEECNVDVLKLEHYAPEDFENCICQDEESSNFLYVFFLRMIDYYTMAMFIWNCVQCYLEGNDKWPIFLDFWGLIFYNSLPVFHFHGRGRLCDDKNDAYLDYMPWYYKLTWIFFSVAVPLNLLAPIAFWTQLYKHTHRVFWIVVNTVTPALLVINFFLVAFPLRLLHFFYFVIVYVIYILFTLIYQKCGGTGIHGSIPIYKALDWRYPWKAILAAFIGLAIGLALYFLFCFLSMCKLSLRDKYVYN